MLGGALIDKCTPVHSLVTQQKRQLEGIGSRFFNTERNMQINVMFLVEPQKYIEYKKILGMKHKYQILKSLF